MMDYDVADTVIDARVRHHPRLRGPDGQPAGPRGLEGRPRAGAAARGAAGDGRPVGPRRPRHPRHRHRRLPVLTAVPALASWAGRARRVQAAPAAGRRRRGRGRAGGADLLRVVRPAARDPGAVHRLPAADPARVPRRCSSSSCSGWPRARSGPTPTGLRVRNGLRVHHVPWARVHRIVMRPGDAWAFALLRPEGATRRTVQRRPRHAEALPGRHPVRRRRVRAGGRLRAAPAPGRGPRAGLLDPARLEQGLDLGHVLVLGGLLRRPAPGLLRRRPRPVRAGAAAVRPAPTCG